VLKSSKAQLLLISSDNHEDQIQPDVVTRADRHGLGERIEQTVIDCSEQMDLISAALLVLSSHMELLDQLPEFNSVSIDAFTQAPSRVPEHVDVYPVNIRKCIFSFLFRFLHELNKG
jgi:hypothetical protein